MDTRTETAVSGRLKKLQPEVTKFEGIYAKLKSRERSGWNEENYISSAIEVYAERHKQQFEFLAAWKELRNKPKWTSQLTTNIGTKHKNSEMPPLTRPGGQKAAKATAERSKLNVLDDIQLRFVAASEKKASIMEQQLHFNIFMQAPESEESKAYFTMQRKAILAQMNTAASDQQEDSGLVPTDNENNENRHQSNTDILESALV
ncbi:hypothetical protein PR003_g16588 [Phytophthora rubi]|uniref:No apical meristem-associated C-terminal domain-containing protein n=1 Tax=Phytophthora rubi TaxID=129364 RepID=A0A6A4END1_9STRA|nr:hypothetical protein PR003_g16588 [Phytophthora rubi]